MKTVMIVLGSGGHTAEIIELTKLMGDKKYKYVYIISPDDLNSVAKIVHKGKIKKIHRPTKWGYNIFQNMLATVKAYFQAKKVINSTKFDAIIGTGPGICLFPMYFARKKGKKIIFIETVNRVNTASQTGKWVYKWADKFFIQWPQQKKYYPQARYEGRLL